MSQRAPGSGPPDAPPDTTQDPGTTDEAEGTPPEETDAVPGSAGQGRRASAESTVEQARDVGDEARREAAGVTDTAKDEVRRVADEAEAQAREAVAGATERLHEQADLQTTRAVASLRRTGQQMEALADGRLEEAGPMPDYARRTASEVTQLADRVDTLGFDGVVGEAQEFARRRPGAFLVGMGIAGFVVGRLGRNRPAGEDR